MLLRRLAAVTVMAETIESRMVNGADIDTNKLCVLASVSVRLAQRLGLDLGIDIKDKDKALS